MAGTRYSTPLGTDSPSNAIDAGTLARTPTPLAGPIGLGGDAVPSGPAVREIQLGFTSTTFQSGRTKVEVTVSGKVPFYRPQARSPM
jgi:hypothetical protein